MRRVVTFCLVLIFNFNAYAFAKGPEVNNVEMQKKEFIQNIDKLIASEKKNPTSKENVRRKIQRNLDHVEKKQKRIISKMNKLSRHGKLKAINRKIIKLKKVNPKIEIPLVTEENIDQVMFALNDAEGIQRIGDEALMEYDRYSTHLEYLESVKVNFEKSSEAGEVALTVIVTLAIWVGIPFLIWGVPALIVIGYFLGGLAVIFGIFALMVSGIR